MRIHVPPPPREGCCFAKFSFWFIYDRILTNLLLRLLAHFAGGDYVKNRRQTQAITVTATAEALYSNSK